MNEKFFKELREKMQTYFEEYKGHGFDHTERVCKMALKISKGENVDIETVKVAALLHDIARMKEEENEAICHAEEGAKMAREILKEMNFPAEKIEKVCHAILVHRFSKQLKAETREAEILQDADRLDALGAIIIARVFMRSGARRRKLYNPNVQPQPEYHGQETNAINHLYEKILKIKPETFKTKKARKIAAKRYAFIEKFLKQFKAEWEGKK